MAIVFTEARPLSRSMQRPHSAMTVTSGADDVDYPDNDAVNSVADYDLASHRQKPFSVR